MKNIYSLTQRTKNNPSSRRRPGSCGFRDGALQHEDPGLRRDDAAGGYSQIANPQSGNALWFILLAIVLLGALTITMSRSGGDSEQTGDFERNRIEASEILRTASSLEQAVNSLRMNMGCSENDISFYTASESASSGYMHTSENESCQLFSRSGSGLNWPGSQWQFGAAAIEGVGTASPELVAIATDLSSDACKAVNRELSLSYPAKDDFDLTKYNVKYTGSFSDYISLGEESITSALPSGKKSACVTISSSPGSMTGDMIFYHVLIVR